MIILHKCVDVFYVLCASCLYESDVVNNQWPGLLDWTTGMDYWTDL